MHVGMILDKFQADNTNIARAVELWLDLFENPDFFSPKSALGKDDFDQSILAVSKICTSILVPEVSGKKIIPCFKLNDHN